MDDLHSRGYPYHFEMNRVVRWRISLLCPWIDSMDLQADSTNSTSLWIYEHWTFGRFAYDILLPTLVAILL